MTKIIPGALVNTMIRDRLVRTSITKDSFLYFFHFYYAHYVKYETADFQKEIIHNLEKSAVENLYIVAFRGSGKSTMVTTAYPIWAILGKQQKKFCIIFCQTKAQAKQHMMNIRAELENNDVLKRDLGPFQEESDEWGSNSLVFKKHGARITVASSDQSIRGLRHNEHRPDLIICDDVEDVQSTRTREGRDKTYNWLRGEVVPAGDKNTRLIIVGNLLHEDSLLMRIKDEIAQGRARGIFKEYPLLDKDDVCLWPGKYKDSKDIEEEKLKVASEISWQREYLLRIIPSDDQVIYPEWINYYDELPGAQHKAYRGTYAGVDLAISSEESADFTAIVSAHVYGRAEKLRIYILPNPIRQKLNFPAQVDLMRDFKATQMPKSTDRFFVESVAYQEALPQMLEMHGIEAESIKPKGDKRTRLSLTSTSIKSGIIKFPRQGCEDLIRELVGFGVEKHDDLADAFSLLVNTTMDHHSQEPTWLMSFLGYEEDRTIYYSDYIDVG
ncbi:MAG: phage terminase large subunit [Candidatus Colwellbacteria bacterium]|nr:phage terminase large subunit [Candidatus Colwellbacteria bacterium]